MTQNSSTESANPSTGVTDNDPSGSNAIPVTITSGVVLFLLTPIFGGILSNFSTSLPDLLTSEVTADTGYASNNFVFTTSTSMAVLGIIILCGIVFHPLTYKLSAVKVLALATLAAIPLAFLTVPMQHKNPSIDEWAEARYGISVGKISGSSASTDLTGSFENRLIDKTDTHPEAVIRKTGDRFFIYDMDGKELPVLADKK